MGVDCGCGGCPRQALAGAASAVDRHRPAGGGAPSAAPIARVRTPLVLELVLAPPASGGSPASHDRPAPAPSARDRYPLARAAVEERTGTHEERRGERRGAMRRGRGRCRDGPDGPMGRWDAATATRPLAGGHPMGVPGRRRGPVEIDPAERSRFAPTLGIERTTRRRYDLGEIRRLFDTDARVLEGLARGGGPQVVNAGEARRWCRASRRIQGRRSPFAICLTVQAGMDSARRRRSRDRRSGSACCRGRRSRSAPAPAR